MTCLDKRNYIDLYIDKFIEDNPLGDALEAAKGAIRFVEQTRKDNLFLRLMTGGPSNPEETEGAKRLRRLGIYTIPIAGCITTWPLDVFTEVYELITHLEEIPWLGEKKCDVYTVCDGFNRGCLSLKIEEVPKKNKDIFSKWEALYKNRALVAEFR